MVTALQTIELTDGGILLYDEAFLPSELADRYFVTSYGISAFGSKSRVSSATCSLD